MSAAHRHTTPDPDYPADASSSHPEAPHRTDTRVDDASPPSVSPANHTRSQSHPQHPCQTQTQTDGHTHTHTLAARIEQTRLRTRVAALERELAASRRNQQAIVDQYERVLEDRECRAENPDRLTESTVAGQNRTDGGSDDARLQAESDSGSGSDSSSGSDSNGSIVGLGAHVRRVLASVSR